MAKKTENSFLRDLFSNCCWLGRHFISSYWMEFQNICFLFLGFLWIQIDEWKSDNPLEYKVYTVPIKLASLFKTKKQGQNYCFEKGKGFTMRRAKISPHQSCQPNLNHFTTVKWITRWEGRDGITVHCFPACRCWELDQLFIRRHSNTDLKGTKFFRPHLDTSRDVFGLPGENNDESWNKTDCCNVLSYFW